MSQPIETWRRILHRDTVAMLAQQQMSRLRPVVRTESVNGKRTSFDFVGTTSMVKRTVRHGDTPVVPVGTARRWVTTDAYDTSDLVDSHDKLQTLGDPSNQYTKAQAAAAGRTIDQTLIDAAFGTAVTGEDATGSVTLPSAQIITTAGGLTLGKLNEAREILEIAEVDPTDEKIAVVTAKQISNMLNDTSNVFTSADFNSVKALVSGSIDSFMGFRFIRSELLPLNGTTRDCLFFTRQSLLLALGAEPRSSVDVRNDLNYSTQVWYSMDIGAVRMQDEGVIKMQCAE